MRTILDEYEDRLKLRLARKKISQATFDAYMNDASRIFEVILTSLPAQAIQGFMEGAGYRGNFKHVIEPLRGLCREPGHMAFPDRPKPIHRPQVKRNLQKRLPGVMDDI